MAEQHLTVVELAERFQVPPGTVYRWNSLGTGPRPIKVGKHCRYRLRDIEAWEQAQADKDRRAE